MMMGKGVIAQIQEAIIDGAVEETERLTREALEAGVDPLEIVNESIKAGLNIVGEGFRKNELFIPELALAGEAARVAGDILGTNISSVRVAEESNSIFVIGTVYGDLHDIGKNLVSVLLKAGGFTVIDLGINQSTEQFVEAVKKHKPDILGLSALLSTTLIEQERVIQALKDEGLRSGVKIMIGGGAVSPEWANTAGADGFAEDAAEAVLVARRLLGMGSEGVDLR